MCPGCLRWPQLATEHWQGQDLPVVLHQHRWGEEGGGGEEGEEGGGGGKG